MFVENIRPKRKAAKFSALHKEHQEVENSERIHILLSLLFFKWKARMCQIYGPLLVLMALSCLFCAKEGMKDTVFCQGYQKPFEGSCYEFISVRRTFFSAQAWCEQHSGHLAFIPDEDTQCFIQRYADPKKDMWLGAASSGPAGEGKRSRLLNTDSWAKF